jgi:hypothetical protein
MNHFKKRQEKIRPLTTAEKLKAAQKAAKSTAGEENQPRPAQPTTHNAQRP